MLEYCRRHEAALRPPEHEPRLLDSAARRPAGPGRRDDAFEPDPPRPLPAGLTRGGRRARSFSTAPPVSLYGATKLASEQLALEYGVDLRLPGLDQPLRRPRRRRPVRPRRPGHLRLLDQQLAAPPAARLHRLRRTAATRCATASTRPTWCRCSSARSRRRTGGLPRVVNVGGGPQSARSLAQLSDWCRERLGDHAGRADPRASGRSTSPGSCSTPSPAHEAWELDAAARATDDDPRGDRRPRRGESRLARALADRRGHVDGHRAPDPSLAAAARSSPSSFRRATRRAASPRPSSTCTSSCGCTTSRTRSSSWTTAARDGTWEILAGARRADPRAAAGPEPGPAWLRPRHRLRPRSR